MNLAPDGPLRLDLPVRPSGRVGRWLAARWRSERWVWILPFFVSYAMVSWPQQRILHILSVLVAGLLFAWAVKWPGRALVFLVVFLPLQAIGFGFLLHFHVPAEILRPAGAIKELLGLGILTTALSALLKGDERLDAIDKALLAYVAVVLVYMVVPSFFTTFPVTHKWNGRLLSFRADCGYALLFFGVRHARLPAKTRQTFTRAVFLMSGLVALIALYQWVRPDQWARFVMNNGSQVRYQVSVLGNSFTTVQKNLSYLTSRNPLRVSSLLISPFDMADYLLVGLALAVERIARQHRSRWIYLLCAADLAAIYASRVRADALAAVLFTVVALMPAPKRTVTARIRLIAAICVAAVLIVPSLGGSRFTNGQGGAASNKGHMTELRAGVAEISRTPLGMGIGNVAGVGDRVVLSSSQQGAFTTDNSVLQVGTELGVQALLPWLIMVILTWRALSRASRRGDALTGGVRLALLGILVAGLYHHVFLNFPLPWTLWAAVGLALKWPTPPNAKITTEGASNMNEPHLTVG